MAQAQAPVIPVQLCKLNPPRNVVLDESRESLQNWTDNCRNFFARDDNFSRFVLPGAVWDPNAVNYGFAAEGQNTKLRRTAPEVAAALERFWSSVSGFFPFNFLTRRFPTSTSWVDMKQMIFKAFNHQVNSSSLLQAHEVLKRSEGENFYIFYERILDYFHQHLVAANVQAAGYNTGPNGDQMHLSMANLIGMFWLEKIDKRLAKIVQIEYGAELRGETQLVELIPRIANDIPMLLAKADDSRVGTINRLRGGARKSSGGFRGRSSGRGGFSSRGRVGRGGASNNQESCSRCIHLGKEMNMNVPSDHNPTECPRRRVHVRSVTKNEVLQYQPEDDYDEEEEYFSDTYDVDEEENEGEPLAPSRNLSHSSYFQEMSEAEKFRDGDQRGRDLKDCVDSHSCVLSSSTANPHSPEPEHSNVSDESSIDYSLIGRVISRLRRLGSCVPTKASSPALTVDYGGKSLRGVVDTGAELNCIDLQVAKDMNIPFKKTSSAVKVPGDGDLELEGVTTSDVIVSSDFNGRSVPLHLQHAVVVNSLGSDIIIGEPAKQRNGLETHSRSRTITVRYGDTTLSKPYLQCIRSDYGVARADSACTVYPGDELWVDAPKELSSEAVLLCTPRRSGLPIPPQFSSVVNGRFKIRNTSDCSFTVSRRKPFAEVRSCTQVKVEDPLPHIKEVEQSCEIEKQEQISEQIRDKRKGTKQNGQSQKQNVQEKFPVTKEKVVSNAQEEVTRGQEKVSDAKKKVSDARKKVSDVKKIPDAEKKISDAEKTSHSTRSSSRAESSVKTERFGAEKKKGKERQESSKSCQSKKGSQQSQARTISSQCSGFSSRTSEFCRSRDSNVSQPGGGCNTAADRHQVPVSGKKDINKNPKPEIQGKVELEQHDISEFVPGVIGGFVGGVIGGLVSYPSDNSRYQNYAKPDPPTDPGHPAIELDPDNVMTAESRKNIMDIAKLYSHVFTKRPGKYNGIFGRVDTDIDFASTPTPNTKVYMPNYSEKQKQEMGRLMDQLMDYGVLQRPEDVGITPVVVSPSLLVPKTEPGEFRLVTDFSALNKHIRKFPSTSPTIAEARNSLARSKYFIHLDLSNYFFQCGISNKNSQYLCTFHPFKGLVCYVVMPQGKKNASEKGYEVLGRVYGDMVADGRLTRQADSLFPQGNTFEELENNFEETLRRADLCGLTFKPGKVVVCPREIVLFGWKLRDSEWTPTAHTTSSLSVATPPTTVKGLRSFLGSFKQFTECVPKYAVLLHGLEKLVGGRASAERIVWSEENLQAFEKAKRATADIKAVTVPRPTDKLTTYSDFSQETRSVGGRLEITRTENGKEKKYHGGYFSVVLDKFKKSWVPCEAEAAGVRLTLLHFEPYIRENQNNTTHFTDNLPVVQAWRRCLQGQFSASSRISTFLSNLSALSVDLVYKPGKLMCSADYSSRHPVPCAESTKCQICKFAGDWQDLGDNSSRIGSITVKDILEGRSLMPFIQTKTWLGQQMVDSVHTRFKKLVDTGQHPDKKKTRGEHTILKSLYKKYQSGEVVIQPDGLVMIKSKDGHFNGKVISVPHHLMAGIAFSLHVKLGHPSKGQLVSLMSRYFYCHGGVAIIQAVADNCVQCRSMQPIPKEFTMDSTEKVEAFGTRFAVDVIERFGQKILLTREKLSQTTWLELIPDQTTSTFRKVILKTVLPWVHSDGAIIRCDGAAALASLAREAETDGSVFKKFGIKLDVGRPVNPNKNAVAENAVKEAEKEILKYKPETKTLTEEDLTVVSKIMNERIRNRGVAAKEILTRRDLITNKPKNISDSKLSGDQFDKRISSNKQSADRKKPQRPELEFHVGDVVYVRNQRSKHQPREQYIVTRLEKDFLLVQKIHSRFGNKEYTVYPNEIMKANAEGDGLFDKVQDMAAEVETAKAPSVVDQAPARENPPVKRKRGRPRKTEIIIDSGADQTRPPRRAAQKARDGWRSNLTLGYLKLGAISNSRSFHYRSSTSNQDCVDECCEVFLGKPSPEEYWWYPPVNNYSFMELEDWTMPNMEQWLELDEEESDDNNQEFLTAEEDLPDHSLELYENPDLLLGAVGNGADGVDLDASSTFDEVSETASPGAVFRTLSRNPESAQQVNLHRVVNLENVPVPPELSGDEDGPRRSRRSKKPNPRYQ